MFVIVSSSHSENYLVKWSSSGLVKDIDQLHNLRAVFTVSVFVPLFVCVCLPWAVAVHCLFSHVMKHVGACLRSLYLLSSLRMSLAHCMYLPRQSPPSNGSLREGRGQRAPAGEHFARFQRYCPQEMSLWMQSQMSPKQFVVKTHSHLHPRKCH